MSVEEITSLMPEIEAFAEIGDYMDQPVRVYSSGMQMRVAFSIATARRPDVLIVDEALSVGDTYFQHKSFDRIREFRKQGTTLLIVSHDKSAIQSICDRAILLNEGKLAMQGQPEAVMDYYNAMIAHKENSKIEQIVLDIGKVQTISGTGEAEIENETGLVVPPSDPLALRQAMRYLWEHPEIAAEMGQRAEDRYWNYFTADKMVEEYVKLYRELAGK
jgi:lipopolysaccharide transport system ATP-binding protein